MIKRKTGILLALLILTVSSFAVAAFIIPTAEELLIQAMETMETVTDGHAIATVEIDTPEQDGNGTVEVWGKLDMGPNGEPAFRAEILEASEEEFVGLTAVADGTQFWLYHPAENVVFIGTFAELQEKMAERIVDQMGEHEEFDFEGELPEHDFGDFDPEDIPETPEEAVAKLLEYFTANRSGTEDIGDSRAHAIRLVPIPEQMPDEVRAAGGFLNVWIRTSDTAPLGIEYAEGALGSGKATFTMLELNQGIDDSIFTFEIPEGAEVINVADLEMPEHEEFDASAADFELLTPAELPTDATLDDSLTMRGAVVERYSFADGGSFTIAQGPASAAENLFDMESGEPISVRGVDGALFTDETEGRTLLTWAENGITFWVGGDLTSEQALTIAESMQ